MPPKKDKKKDKKDKKGDDDGQDEVGEVGAWLSHPAVALESRIEDFTNMGIKVVADFAVMDEADLEQLFPKGGTEEGKTKFDRKRFLKALQQSMPQFAVEELVWRVGEGKSPDSAADSAPAEPRAPSSDDTSTPTDAAEVSSDTDDDLAKSLSDALLSDFDTALRSIGVRTTADLLEMNADDIRGLRMDKFSRKRFDQLRDSQRAEAPANQPGEEKDGGDASEGADAPAAAMYSQPGGSGGAASGRLCATRPGPTPEISMRQGSRLAQQQLSQTLSGGGSGSNTVTSFYNHWAATNRKPSEGYGRLRYTAPRSASYGNPGPNQEDDLDAQAQASVHADSDEGAD